MNHILLGLSTFFASAVEMVEALTIVLAIGASRQWRSTMYGTAAAIGTLAVMTALFGTSIEHIPQQWLWLIMGGLLTIFGTQWLRKAILRFTGIKSLHDEEATYKKVQAEAAHIKKTGTRAMDWYAFSIVFKGVFIEGLEVIFIVVAFGSSQNNISVGVAAAAAAFVVVSALGLLLHRPLARVPENGMKFFVGLILTSFGTYFASMGAGVIWSGGKFAMVDILIFYILVSVGLIAAKGGLTSNLERRI